MVKIDSMDSPTEVSLANFENFQITKHCLARIKLIYNAKVKLRFV